MTENRVVISLKQNNRSDRIIDERYFNLTKNMLWIEKNKLHLIDSVRLQDQEDEDSDVVVALSELQRPPQYAVVLLNDDYTPMDFVIEILQQYFNLDLDQATQVMLTVHHEGKGIAGVYPRDIAETKASQVNHYARSQGHPLLCQIEAQQ